MISLGPPIGASDVEAGDAEARAGSRRAMMTFIQRAVEVNAPADKVFDLIDTPRRVPEWAAGITSVSDIRESEGRIGDTMKATYSVMGMRFPMIWAITEYEKPTKLRFYARGGIGGNKIGRASCRERV